MKKYITPLCGACCYESSKGHIHMKTDIIFFSPTGTTRKIVHAFADGLGCEVCFTDITQPENRNALKQKDCGLMVIASPVYEENVPKLVLDCIKSLDGKGRPLAVISVYGNVGFGKSLVRLKQYALAHNFRFIGAGLFIGEHTFAGPELPVALGRPDAADLAEAVEFGKMVRDKLESGDLSPVCVPASRPPLVMRLVPNGGTRLFVKLPELDAGLCTRCKLCAKTCPTGAIDSKTFAVDGKKCIRCFACVKGCAQKARTAPFRLKLFARVFRTFGRVRKDNQIFV